MSEIEYMKFAEVFKKLNENNQRFIIAIQQALAFSQISNKSIVENK